MTIDLQNNIITANSDHAGFKEHRPLFTTIRQVEILVDGKILVCEDYYDFNFNKQSNLYCLNRTLGLEWFAALPNTQLKLDDAYVGFSSFGDSIFANSFSCYRVEINLKNGNPISVQFTK